MPSETVYCIDTSALIDLAHDYPRDVFPGLWENLATLVSQGRLIAPREVLTEICRGDDDLAKWAKKHKRMFVGLDAAQVRTVADIMSRFPGLVDPNRDVDADPHVVALAVVRKQSPDESLFVRRNHTVVTHENLAPANGRPKIPNVCAAHNVEHIRVVEMFRREGWEFRGPAAQRK